MDEKNLNGMIETLKAEGVEPEIAKKGLEKYIKTHPLEVKRLMRKLRKQAKREQRQTQSSISYSVKGE